MTWCSAWADSLAGLHGVVAVLAALRLRERTGQGQHIDMAMLDAVIATDDYMHHIADESFPVWPVRGQVWDAAGGPIMVAADPKKIWADLSRAFGLSDPSPPGADVPTKAATRAEVVAGWFRSFPSRVQLVEALDEAGLAWGDVRRPADLAEAPVVRFRNLLVEVDDRAGGRGRVVQSPYRFSDRLRRCARSGPRPRRLAGAAQPIIDGVPRLTSTTERLARPLLEAGTGGGDDRRGGQRVAVVLAALPVVMVEELLRRLVDELAGVRVKVAWARAPFSVAAVTV